MRKRIWLLSGVFVFGLIVLSRDALIAKGAEVYFHRKMATQGWKVESLEREKHALKLKKLSYENTLIEEAHVAFHLSLFPLQLQPKIHIPQVSIEILENQSSDNALLGLFASLGNPKLDLKLSIKEGMIKGLLKEPLNFSFEMGQDKREMGTLLLQDAAKNMFLSTHLKWEGESIVSQVEIDQGKTSDLLALASFVQTPLLKGWKESQGNVSASLKSRFHPKKGLEEMEGKIDLKEVSCSHPTLGIDVVSKSLTGTLLFSSDLLKQEVLSFWKNVELFLTFEDTHLQINQKDLQLGAKNLLGELRLHPEEDPYLKVGGDLLSKNLCIPFEVEGKGQILEKENFWLQTQADFFLPKTSSHLSFSFSKKENPLLEMECKSLSYEVFNVLSLAFPLFDLPQCQMLQGEISGKFIGILEGNGFKEISCNECLAQGVSLLIPALDSSIKLQHLAFSTLLQKGEKESLEITALEASLRKADVLFQGKEMIRSLSSKIQVEAGEFTPSYIEGTYHGIWGSLQVLGPESKNLLHVECKAFPQDFISKVWKEGKVDSSQNNPIFLSLDLSSQEEKAQGDATLRFISSKGIEEDVEIELSMDKKLSRKVSDLCSTWDFSTCKGSFKTEKLSSETGSIWMRPWLGTLAIDGELKGEGSFDEKGLLVDVSEVDFELSGSFWDVSAKLGSNEKKIHIAYEYKEGVWKGSVPVDFLKLKNSQLHLEAEIQDSLVFFEGDQIWADHLQADIEGSKIFGKLLANSKSVQIASKAFEGTLLSLQPVLSKAFPQLSLANLNGLFSIEDQGCILDGKKQESGWNWDWKFAASLKEMVYELGKPGKIQQARCLLEGNAKGEFKLKDTQGVYVSKTAHCPFALSDLSWGPEQGYSTDISFLAKEGKREWMFLQGRVSKEQDGIQISLSPKTHLLGVLVNVAPFTIKSDLTCSPLHLKSSLKLEQMPSYIKMWKEMGFVTLEPSMLDSCQGTLHLQGIYNVHKEAWKVNVQSSEISRGNETIGKAEVSLLGEKNRVKFESCKVGPWSLKGSLDLLETEWSSSSLMLEWKEGKCLLKGKYTPSSSKFQVPAFSVAAFSKEIGNVQLQGSFEGLYVRETSSLQGKGSSKLSATLPAALGLTLESVKDIPFSFDTSKGIYVEKSQWELNSFTSGKQRLGKVAAKAISFLLPEKKLTLQGGSILVPKEAYKILQNVSFLSEALKEIEIHQEIDLQADVEMSLDHKKISGSIKNGTYGYKGNCLDLKQTKFLLEGEDLYLSSQTKYQEDLLSLSLQMNLSKMPSACLLLKENPESRGLALKLRKSLKEGWFCEALQGSFKGIAIEAQKEAGKNIYDLEVKADLTHIPSLLSKPFAQSMKKWGLGQGYTFQGQVSLAPGSFFEVVSLKGNLSGEKFQFLGKIFDSFTAKVDFGKDKGKILGVKLEDEVAKLTIKTIDCAFNPKSSSWDISSPLVYVKDFAPALLLKGNKERGVEIKNLSLYELNGTLSSVESFEAKGALYFSSLEKKEFSFWDIPLTMMKDWGLDPGILTPVTGEADFVLKRGCFYFTALHNVYSEGKRSQFYLAEANKDAYLSLDGNWHVDLAMKQNVVWKVTEDLILSIRGTVEKPKYSFKSNKKGR